MSAVSQRWPEVARALQAHGFPPVQPQPPAAAAAAAAGGNSANQNSTIFSHDEATKLQATLLALLSQRSRHAVLVQELGDAAGRAEQQALVAQQRAAAVEDQLSSIRAMLTVEQDAVRRERRLREADQQQHRLAVAQLEAALRSAQEREAEAQRQVQVMQNHTQELREAAAAQAARETAHRQLLEQLFVELHGRQMDPHSSHDSRLLEMMDMYEARLQAAAQEIQRLQTQRLSAAGSQAPRTLGEAAMADVYAMANDDGQRIATAGTSAAHSSAAKEQFVALTQERDQLRSQLAAAETELRNRPTTQVLRSTQRALRQAKQELADTQRKLKHGAHGEADQQNAPPQPVHNLSAAELRQRLEDMSRALSASPEHLVQAIQQVDELREFATQTAQGIRDIAGVPRPTRRQTSKTAPIEPDWDVLGLLTQIRHSFAATVDEHTVQGATLDYISARLKEALSSGPSVQDIDAEVGAVVQAGAVEAMEPQDSKPATATEETTTTANAEVQTLEDNNLFETALSVLRHVADTLNVVDASEIIPSLRTLRGKWVEMHTAWMILHSSVAADVEFDSPATTMRLVLTQLAERAAEGTVDALVEMLQVPAQEIVAEVEGLVQRVQQYEEYVPQFQRWAEEVLRVTGQSSLQELMQNYDGQAEDGVDNAQLFEPSVGEMPLEAGTEEQQDEAEATAAAESVQTATDEAPAEWETAPAELATAPEAVPSDVAGTHEAPQIEAAAVELEPSEMGDEESPAVPQQPTSTNTVTHMSRQLPSVPRAQLRASPSRLTVFEEPATTAAPTGPAAQAAQPRKVVVLKRSNPAPRSPLAINRGGVIAMYSPNTNVPSQ